MLHTEHKKLVHGLGYFGLIPFVAAAFASFFNIAFAGLDFTAWFVNYSAIILVFLCGSLWGRVLDQATNGFSPFVLGCSNILALIAWLALGLFKHLELLSLFLLMSAHIAVLWLEISQAEILYRKVDKAYRKLRFQLTLVVVALHIFMLFITAA